MEAATVSSPVSRGAPRRLRLCADERLVARIRAGDERCFEVAYDRYHRQLLAFCRHMLGTREEAEDALQQVFVSAHRQLLADDRPVQLKPWLYAIARNRCLSTLRDRRATVAIDSAPEPSTDGLAVAAEVERRQDLKDMLGDLATLPDDERAALVLAELGDLSHEEIAVALGVRKDRIKALIFQARKTLLGSREAREADCAEIQEQLATLRGGALRRSTLRRHVAVCSACASFEGEVGRQRAALGMVLPVIPTLALKNGILTSVLASGSAAGSGAVAVAGLGGAAGAGAGVAGAGSVAGAAATGLAVKVLAVVAVGGGALGVGAVVQRADRGPSAPASRPQESRPLAPAPATGALGGPATPAPGSNAPGSRQALVSAARARARARAKAAKRRAAARRGSAGRSFDAAKPGKAKTREPKNAAEPTAPGAKGRSTPLLDGAPSGSSKPTITGRLDLNPGPLRRAPRTGADKQPSGDIGAGPLRDGRRSQLPALTP